MAYIRQEDAINAINKAVNDKTWSMSDRDVIESIEEYVEALPAIDVVEVKHGNWTFARSGRKVVCSCCETPAPFDKKVGYHTLWSSPYCPNCGAKTE